MEKLTSDIKKQLGIIIKGTRMLKHDAYLAEHGKNDNPYNKVNFCEHNEICHVNTLTNLENGGLSKARLYDIFLRKLDLSFDVTLDKHDENMKYIDSLIFDILQAVDDVNDNLVEQIYLKAYEANFEADIIAQIIRKIIHVIYGFSNRKDPQGHWFKEVELYAPLFTGLSEGAYFYCQAILKHKIFHMNEAEPIFLKAKSILDRYHVSKGLVNMQLITNYHVMIKYYDMFRLCKEMEAYYLENNNNNRLVLIYSFMANYYMMFDLKNLSEEYFHKSLTILEQNKSTKRYAYFVKYNWASECFIQGYDDLALKYKLESLKDSPPEFPDLYASSLNYVLCILDRMHAPRAEVLKYLNEDEKIFDGIPEPYKEDYLYFKYKYTDSPLFRKHAIEKIIPYFKKYIDMIERLLIVYQDLYE